MDDLPDDDARAPWRSHPADARFDFWAARDSTNLRRMSWPPPAGTKRRGSMLFANGRGDFIEKYLEAYDHWRGQGWHVGAFDWRGQGASGAGPADPEPLFDLMAEDLAALASEWRRDGDPPHVAIAHSMGGHLLLRGLVQKEIRLDAAVLVAPLIQVNSWPLPPLGARWTAELACMFGQSEAPIWRQTGEEALAQRRAFLTGSPERFEDEVWWHRREPRYNLKGPSWGWLRSALQSLGRFGEAELAGLDLPILLIGSANDRLVDVAAIRRAAQVIPGAELHLYPRAGHEILREADPIRSDALCRIDEFLAANAP